MNAIEGGHRRSRRSRRSKTMKTIKTMKTMKTKKIIRVIGVIREGFIQKKKVVKFHNFGPDPPP